MLADQTLLRRKKVRIDGRSTFDQNRSRSEIQTFRILNVIDEPTEKTRFDVPRKDDPRNPSIVEMNLPRKIRWETAAVHLLKLTEDLVQLPFCPTLRKQPFVAAAKIACRFVAAST